MSQAVCPQCGEAPYSGSHNGTSCYKCRIPGCDWYRQPLARTKAELKRVNYELQDSGQTVCVETTIIDEVERAAEAAGIDGTPRLESVDVDNKALGNVTLTLRAVPQEGDSA